MTNQFGEFNASLKLNWIWIIYASTILAGLIFIFREGLSVMLSWWENSPEYNHGYLIPFVAVYLALLKADAIRKIKFSGSRSGFPILLLGLSLLYVGELSAVYIITQYAFLISLIGLVIMAYGWPTARKLWAPVAYLFFMIPLPSFLYNGLSSELQLLSSQLGVAFLRLAGVSVYLEGNVIDLGQFQLQVAEACSGLRYLFPLMSFGFLCAFLFKAKAWQKALIFFSSIPITVLMNSFRIGVIGLLVEFYGISMARGFLHDFEGWVIFMACVGLMFFELWCFAFFGRKKFIDVFDVPFPPLKSFKAFVPRIVPSRATWLLIGIFVFIGISMNDLQSREEFVPLRQPLSTFPLKINDWRGSEIGLEKAVLDELKLDDYLLASYSKLDNQIPIELYVAFYDSQRKGASTHSPKACLPGGGWNIDEFDQYQIDNIGPFNQTMLINRSIISLAGTKQLVYYWFPQRGRIITNEYLVKWFIFWDAITMNRTDGALVRLVTAVPNGVDISESENRVKDFMRTIDPQLNFFLPGKLARPRDS
ncbi:MAG: VPLPA-CTERM-specific exosortase XrtD [Pseudomonadota bacterium]|nr:VPLPA-CTERM-specific exosortase XrtD [Pseudomonadota bacterium]